MLENIDINTWQFAVAILVLLGGGNILFTVWGYKFFVLPLAGAFCGFLLIQDAALRYLLVSTDKWMLGAVSTIPILYLVAILLLIVGGREKWKALRKVSDDNNTGQ